MPRSWPTHDANVIVTGLLGSGTGPLPVEAFLSVPPLEPQPTASAPNTANDAQGTVLFSTGVLSSSVVFGVT
jgi:hypothetical protein